MSNMGENIYRNRNYNHLQDQQDEIYIGKPKVKYVFHRDGTGIGTLA